MKQLIDLLVGRPGAGKTENMVKREIEVPGRYLFSCPRIDLIRERISDIQRHAAMQGVAPPIIEEAHSQTGGVETVVVRGKSQRKPVDERSQAKREEEHRNKAAARRRRRRLRVDTENG